MDVCDRLIIGESQPIIKTKELIRQVANSDLNVIICGESGVGKELVAQALHLSSLRRDRPFIKVIALPSPGNFSKVSLYTYIYIYIHIYIYMYVYISMIVGLLSQ